MNSAKKKSFFVAVVCLILCVALLVGTTFAWFSDSVSNTGNRIQAGNLKIDLLKHDGTDYVTIANGTGDIFTDSGSGAVKWEPGQTQFAFLAVENKGNLALKYNTYIDVTDGGLVGSLEYALIPVSKQQAGDLTGKTWDYIKSISGVETGDIAAGRTVLTSGVLDEIAYDSTKTGERDYAMLAVHMKEEAGNQYQNKNIIIDVTLAATQYTAEEDGFGSNQYDAQATPVAPEVTRVTGTGTIPKDGDAKAEIVITDATQNPKVKATIPASSEAVVFTDTGDNVHNVDTTQHDTVLQLDVVAGSIQADSVTYDITMKNVTDSYTVKSVNKVIGIDLSIGKGLKNVTVAHNGTPMTEASTGADQTYSYNPVTGIVTICTSSFSPFTIGYDYEADVAITKEGETTVYTTLAGLSDSVNKGNSYAGYTVTLIKDVNLSGADWTPIGTSSHPFSGIFDGNSKVISNMSVKAAGKEGSGLFGYIKGSKSGELNKTVLFTDGTFNSNLIKETDYDCVIKNLTVKDASVSLTSGDIRNVAAAVGIAEKAYIKNVNITGNTTVNVYKYGAGIAGLTKTAVIDGCSVADTVKIQGADPSDKTDGGGHMAGLVAYDYEQPIAVINCTNNASVSAKYGYTGGIIAYAGGNANGNATIYNCVNNGTVATSGTALLSAGIVGNGQGAPYILFSVNNGAVSGTAKDSISGISSYFCGKMYSCTNNGNINGNASYVGGLVGQSYQSSVDIENCSNTGTVTNSKEGGKVSEYVASTGWGTTVSGQTFADVAALANAVSGVSDTLILKNLTVTDATGTFEVPAGINNIIADRQYFAGLDISGCTHDYITVTISDFNYALHGDASSKTLGLSGANNTTTFASDSRLDWLRNYGSNGKYVKEAGCSVNTIHGATEIK